MNNVFLINPRRTQYGVWIFDDKQRALQGEPFVGNTNRVIDSIVVKAKLTNPENGFLCFFSATPLPNYHSSLTLVETSAGGSTYEEDGTLEEAWLCPALFKFLPQAPAKLYVYAENQP